MSRCCRRSALVFADGGAAPHPSVAASEGWGFESLRARHVSPGQRHSRPTPRPPPGRWNSNGDSNAERPNYLSTSACWVASGRVLDGLARSVVRTAEGSAKELLEALDNARLQPTEHATPHHDGVEWTQEGGPADRSDGVRCSGRHSLTGILTGRVLRDARTDVSPLTCAVPAGGSPIGRACSIWCSTR